MMLKFWTFTLFFLIFTLGTTVVGNPFHEINGTVTGFQTLTRAESPYLVTSDLIVTQNSTLTIEAGTEVAVVPNVGIRVHGTLFAKGTQSRKITFRAIPCNETRFCNSTKLYNPGIRLVDGTSYNNGRLELEWNGQWGTVCDRNYYHYWSSKTIDVACRHLGFLGGKRSYHYRGPSGPIWIRSVSCNGKEESLWQCNYRGIGQTGCSHGYDIGIECETLVHFLKESVYWSGIYFSPLNSSQKNDNSSLEHVEIMNAFEGVKASRSVSVLSDVAVGHGFTGFLFRDLTRPLKVANVSIVRCDFVGINITSLGAPVVMDDVSVENTKHGDGLVYNQIADFVDFCSVISKEASFPLALKVSRNSTENNCSKIFLAPPGGRLSVHFRLISGSEFELNVTDGSKSNKTMLRRITSNYNGNVVKTASSSVLEISFHCTRDVRLPKLEMVIVDEEGLPLSLLVSRGNFVNNFKSGVSIYNLAGRSQFMETIVKQSGFSGLHTLLTHGKLDVVSTRFLSNRKHGVHIERMTGLAEFENVNSSDNQESGVIFEGGSISLFMSNSTVQKNTENGLLISHQVNSTINISGLKSLQTINTHGIYMLNFAENCNVHLANVVSSGNRGNNGAYFERISATIFTITSSSFDGNGWHGLSFSKVITRDIILKKVSTSRNDNTGVYIITGKSIFNIEDLTSVENIKDGFYVTKQEGTVIVENSAVAYNQRDGIVVVDDSDAGLDSFDIQGCSVLNNRYGISFGHSYNKVSANFTITIANTTIANNTEAGCEFYSYNCYRGHNTEKRVQLSFTGNKVKWNKKLGVLFSSPEEYQLNAILKRNLLQGNTGYTLRFIHNPNDYCHRRNPFPVTVNLIENTFVDNKGEYVVFVDYKSLPDKRSMVIKNNTFKNNKVVRQFSSRYIRTKTQAVLAINEGTFNVLHNLFENPQFPHELATLFQDHERMFQASENWWGSKDECHVKTRIFDFEDRVELAQILYYPFMVFRNTSNVKLHNDSRPICFLKGNQLGGTLNRSVTLCKDTGPYQVTGDATVLLDGVLTIEENVTLEFPLQGVFLIYGQVIIKGTAIKRASFVPKIPRENLRLVDGPGPWEGGLEIWVNKTWMSVCLRSYHHESAIVCRQLGYERYSYDYRSPSGRENIFLHNVYCDTNENENIANCHQDQWISQSTCSRYVAYIICKIPYWSGIHLPITPKKSVITDLDITYAGFAYRSDLSVPGIALRIDLSHHNISGVTVDKSASIGVQIMYPDPFKSSSDLKDSRISHSSSDGIRLESPFIKIVNSDVLNTEGRGFFSSVNWNSLNTHVTTMAARQVKSNFNMCSQKNIFLDRSSLVYYLQVTKWNRQSCKSIITVPQEYTIGMQLIYHDLSYSHGFHAYSGTKSTSNNIWGIHALNWRGRPTWMSNNNSVLLASPFYSYSSLSSAHFLLFLVKGNNHSVAGLPNLIIYNSTFIGNSLGGIVLGDGRSLLGNTTIESSVIFGSPRDGLHADLSGLSYLTVLNSSLDSNKNGIMLFRVSGNINIENSMVSNSTYNALYVSSDGYKTIHLSNSRIVHSKGNAIHLFGDRAQLRLLVVNTFFAWNKATTIYSQKRWPTQDSFLPLASFKNCTFIMSPGPVVHIMKSSFLERWEFVDNVFLNNTEPSVILTTEDTDMRYLPTIYLKRNKFLFNHCPSRGVVDVTGGTKDFIIEDNLFEGNRGRSIFLDETSHSSLKARRNVFKDNNCLQQGVVEVRASDKNIEMFGNIFQSNEGLFMVSLHCGYYIDLQMTNGQVNFTNNSFINNVKILNRSLDCELNVSGLMEYKTFTVHNNIFNSRAFAKELCLNIFASDHSRSLDVSYNYWGYDDQAEIRNRIFHAEINYEYALAVFKPFLSGTGKVIYGTSHTSIFIAKDSLGGRLSSDVHLDMRYSPYKVVSDLTILPNGSLTIDPGVEVLFDSGVGVLVLGSLFVNGTEIHPVKFSVTKNNHSSKATPVRLFGGTFPWQGHVEMLYNEKWIPLCSNHNQDQMNTAKVICKQLGYQTPTISNHNNNQSHCLACKFSVRASCFGNETDLSHCQVALRNESCNSSRPVVLNCTGGLPWGNIRFLREVRAQHKLPSSKLDHLMIEHCGKKHGKEVPAIEIFQYVPEVNSVHIVNCTAGGIRVWFPEKEVFLKNSSTINSRGDGIEILITKRNVTLEKVSSMKNAEGVTFIEPNGAWMNGLSYGQVMFCASEEIVNLDDGAVFLYFKPSSITYYNPYVICKKVVQTRPHDGFAAKLIVVKNVEYITVQDRNRKEILKYSRRSGNPLSQQRLIPWNTITIFFKGWFSTTEVLLHIQRVEASDLPCTFEVTDCGWRNYLGSHLNSVSLTWPWKWPDIYGFHSGIPDHTYAYHGSSGNYMWLGMRSYTSGYGAFTSPLISPEDNYCYLTFYYMLREFGQASLTIFTEETTSKNLTTVWSTGDSMFYWRKKVLSLPRISSNYSVVFLGYFQHRYSVPYVTVDDIHFTTCDDSLSTLHHISECTVSGNLGYGINYQSTQAGGHLFRIERSKIENNGLSSRFTGATYEAIHLEAVNQVFQVCNNYLADNKNMTFYAKMKNEESAPTLPTSQLHANVIEWNRGATLLLEGSYGPYRSVKITDNYFSMNLATDLDDNRHSVCNISNLVAHLEGNFFYNNSGQYVLEYSFPLVSGRGLTFVNNTLFKNEGVGANYGITILCNGEAEMHGNVLQNPRNRFQFSTTWRGNPVNVNATSNWWGENALQLVAPLIMDKTKDYRLTLTVIFEPFVKLQPQATISVSCPPEWIKDDELCYLYRGSSFTFQEARKYCENYGGNIIAMFMAEDVELVKNLRRKESLVRPTDLPSLWTINRDVLTEDNIDLQSGSETCPVLDKYGNITESDCDRLHPAVCVRRPVVYCPNGCFHNGVCIGAICFCYPGWTGEDCSQFHCHDLHNCSGNGQCIGPNVCKCYPGYLGRGCTYSYCGKYENCTDCVTDPYCGWCESSRSCLGGFAEGPPKISCPGWFYYHCYTVGDGRNCSDDISVVDCANKQCNYKSGKATTESCQRCNDLEKCYKTEEDGHCRAWNETRCPGGRVQVDYTDPQRLVNVLLAKNVKIVQPNTTIIYACPIMLEEQQKTALVFVTPKELDVKKGDVLCSPQAGGIMHKIVKELIDGPFKAMLSAPAGLEEVINYADFKEEASVESVEDESTLEDEPDNQDLHDLIAGNVTVNGSRIIIIQTATYKCLGHSYDFGGITVLSYYLVIQSNLTTPRAGDTLISNTSDGFIETVVSIHKTEDTVYLETKLQQCSENFQVNFTRLRQSKVGFSKSAFCSGGDNNPGLIMSPASENVPELTVNESIVGRESKGFIAKVVKVHLDEEFTLVEVISATLNGNGSFTTAVDISQLQSNRRRTRRSADRDRKATGNPQFNPSSISYKILSSLNANIEARLSYSLGLNVFLDIQKSSFGGFEDASLGLVLRGSLYSSLKISISGKLSGSFRATLKRQLGGTKYIRLGPIPVSLGIFLELSGSATAALTGSVYQSVSASGSIAIGGKCRWSRRRCCITDKEISFNSNWNQPRPKAKAGASLDVTVVPTISIKIPGGPNVKGKSSPLKVLKKLVEKVYEVLDISFSIFAKAPLKAGISMRYPSQHCKGRTPAELQSYYGLSDVSFGVSVSFMGKRAGLTFNSGFSRTKRSSRCVCPISELCVGPTGKLPGYEDPPDSPEDPEQKRGRNNGKWNPATSKCNAREGPEPPCGQHSVCSGMRVGANCSQPDTEALKNCSGNGTPEIAPKCKARCNCFGGWEGEFCEIISARGGGDPHLETLDGVNFDFFGIGEYWGCRSKYNDFGLQFRLFYFERASLIGGVALKAGASVITVMAIKTIRAQDSPIVRIDGSLINVTTNSSKPIEINNGTILLDRQVRFTFEEEENSVVLISLQYESGLTVTIDVKHSRVMKRQYLNVVYSPTAAYKGHTDGLCGLMDNNATNDFMGPDGTIFGDAVQFAESWKIKKSHQGSGERNSWSWASSNFYPKDTMDQSYLDVSFRPIYTLQGISQSLLELATSMCKSLNISDNNLRSCIYDVAVTNDTTFTDQEEFKQGCPDKCSGKGRCVNGTCKCINGWAGDSCNQGSCLNCSTDHGKCAKGFCVCNLGWEGRSCEKKATCHNVNNCTNSVHGTCKTTDICQCNPGYVGPDCSIIPTCYNVSNCTENGICVDFDVCECDKGWNGTNCTQFSCEHFDHCSGHGRCVAFETCSCDYGWTGASCALPDCGSVNHCSGKGECVASETCRCYPGYIGANCSELADCYEFANCSGNGVCLSPDSFNVSCSCYAGFTGPNCSHPTCPSLSNCSGHGKCIEAELCKCDFGFNGTDCSNYSCEAINSCSGHGQCVEYDVCNCSSSWSGLACNIPDCSGVNDCSRQGDCILVNTCACYPSFDGEACDRKAKPNIHTPIFEQTFYNASIMENAPVGTLIFQVRANDTDLGRNGQLFYSALGENNVGNLIAIDGGSGKVYSSFTFDFETMETPSFNVTLVASDNGSPQKSSMTIAQITVLDDNDNCPLFTRPSENLKLEISDTEMGDVVTKVLATDLDSGENGDLTYSLSDNAAFSIDRKTGLITVASNLTETEYQLTVGASDNGQTSCLTEIRFIVKVISLSTEKPSIKPPSSPFGTSSTATTPKTETAPKTEIAPKTSQSTGTDNTLKSSTTPPGTTSPLTSEEDATAAPQTSQKYVVIGVSAGVGLLVLIIAAVITRKIICKFRPTPQRNMIGQGAKGNEGFHGDFELSTIPAKI